VTLEEDAELAAIRAHMLNGRRPQPRRELYKDRRIERPIDPAELDPYDRLLYERSGPMSRAVLARCLFAWCQADVGIEELRRWLDAGAGAWDADLAVKFRQAGVPPEIASAPVLRSGRDTGQTYFQLARQGAIEPETVRTIAEQAGWRAQREDAS
jgi:hypothetical protein